MEIVCRSTAQIYEDNLCELHTRLVRWTKELWNTGVFTSRELQRKRDNLEQLRMLTVYVEAAMLDGTYVELSAIELRAISLATMMPM